MRLVLFMIVALGVFGAMAGHFHSPQAAAQNIGIVNEAAAGSETTGTSNSDRAPSNDGALDIPRSPDGHFYADVDVNGTKLHMLIDTGATVIALSREDARSAGIATSIGMPEVVGEGADGSIHGEIVTIDRLSLGTAKAEAMPAIVLNNGSQSLLGQAFLAKFASVEIHGETMTLR